MSSLTTRLILVASIVALLLASCGGSEDSGASASPSTTEPTATNEATATTDTLPEITLPPRPPSDYAGFVAQTTACGGEAPQLATPMTFAAPEDQALDPGAVVQATMVTSCGSIDIELDPGIAPDTVNSFVFLARSGYFDGTVSHRVVPGFVIQAGDPTATGREGPGYTIKDELPEVGFVYERGVLAMTNSGPDSTGSQFFIVLADAPLNPAFSYFGSVVDGFETLDLISQIPLGPNAFGEVSVPLETLYIEHVTVTEP